MESDPDVSYNPPPDAPCGEPFKGGGVYSASGRRFRESLAPGEIPLRPLDLLATLHEAPEEYESGDRRVKNREAQRRSRRMVVNREGVLTLLRVTGGRR